jgi:uncharacterized protein (DUF983 family)
MSSEKMVSRPKSFFLDGDNMPLLLTLSLSIIGNVVGGPIMVQMFPTHPVMWATLVFITLFNAGAVFLTMKLRRQERREHFAQVAS